VQLSRDAAQASESVLLNAFVGRVAEFLGLSPANVHVTGLKVDKKRVAVFVFELTGKRVHVCVYVCVLMIVPRYAHTNTRLYIFVYCRQKH
jgi:hypothetical protein